MQEAVAAATRYAFLLPFVVIGVCAPNLLLQPRCLVLEDLLLSHEGVVFPLKLLSLRSDRLLLVVHC